jgi:hypothetical protein
LRGASVALVHLQLEQRTNEGSCDSSPSSINFPVGACSGRNEERREEERKNNIHEPQRQHLKMVCCHYSYPHLFPCNCSGSINSNLDQGAGNCNCVEDSDEPRFATSYSNFQNLRLGLMLIELLSRFATPPPRYTQPSLRGLAVPTCGFPSRYGVFPIPAEDGADVKSRTPGKRPKRSTDGSWVELLHSSRMSKHTRRLFP